MGNEATVWFYGFGTFSLCVDWLFFNPGPYAGYLAMILPICLYHYLRVPEKWRYLCKSLKIEKLQLLWRVCLFFVYCLPP